MRRSTKYRQRTARIVRADYASSAHDCKVRNHAADERSGVRGVDRHPAYSAICSAMKFWFSQKHFFTTCPTLGACSVSWLSRA